MKERNNCLDKIKEEMKVKLKNERTNNRGRYLDTLKNLITQAMIKLIEPELKGVADRWYDETARLISDPELDRKLAEAGGAP